ncbi:vhs domain containing protein family [Holotrichia oblita]|uniref:Vhs domain containing protein family n=1 Tax=Holotrichia oblita TaxID=644536 RepID=A0ACB9TXL9_HOLOL|nr:vhs domain containing protein family [Holotrichia oblita]
MSFFSNTLGGNPFSTPVGSRIEQATDGTLASENWSLNMEICDMVNETEEGPKDAIKAIRKRLVQNAGKNYTVVMYTLTVLETCVKNCGKPFHILACSKDFIQELVKLIGPKNDPPTAVQEKVLSLIQSWADAFKTQPDLSGVVSVYSDLIAKGIEFPPTDLDAMAPIHTPQRSVEPSVTPAREVSPSSAPLPQIATAPIVAASGQLTSDQRVKLQSELDVVQSNMVVLGEMLNEMQPGNEQPDELELLQELSATCHSMQERLVDLISKLSNDEITADLLRINDDMNNLFLRYSRWEKNREAGGQSASAVLAKAIIPNHKPLQSEDSLIDLGPPDDLTNQLSMSNTSASAQLANIGTVTARNGPQGDDEFDMFAQSRKATYEKSKTEGSSYKDNLEPDQVPGGLSSVTQKNKDSGGEETVTSSEFERFLAERAAAAEALPSTAESQRNNQKSTKEEKELFAL